MTSQVELDRDVPVRVREQMPLWRSYDTGEASKTELRDAAAMENKTQPIHRWVPWIAGFSAQFVEDAIEAYLPASRRDQALVLDPFAGVATTLIEALKHGCNVVGYDINPFAVLAARAKINCVDVLVDDFRHEVSAFRSAMLRFEQHVDRRYATDGAEGVAEIIAGLPLGAPSRFRSRIPFFSPPVQAKFLYALARTTVLLEPDRSLFRAALGATMVPFSNYSYEPSLSSRPGAGKALIDNAPVGTVVCRKLDEMLEDIEFIQDTYGTAWRATERAMHHGSYFSSELAPQTVSLLVTSPPYMNNYHYVRNTRPQLHWLDLLDGSGRLRALEEDNFGKFWQTVRQRERIDLAFDFPELAGAIDHVRTLNPHKGYYGGQGWANYVATYFNDTHRFVGLVKRHLQPGAHAVIVVGNSIIQGVEFKVDHLLAQIAERQDMSVDDIHIVRTKRVGNSIVGSSVRNDENNGHREAIQLYDAAVVLRA
ncbi:MAG: DNA methyltransferase [Dehalococcoidia bacterium]